MYLVMSELFLLISVCVSTLGFAALILLCGMEVVLDIVCIVEDDME